MAKAENVIMLRGVRGSFLTLGEPERYQNDPKNEPRWSATGLLKKDDPQVALLDELIETVGLAKWEKKWSSVKKTIEGDKKSSFKVDGETKDYAGYEGCFALTAHRKLKEGRPLVMDTDKSPIYKADGNLYEGKAGRVYSGCYLNMQIQVWAQSNEHGKAIRATLLAVQRQKDGDAFSGGAAPNSEDFEEIEDGADADDLG